jgi:Glyoxalase-like domain
MATQIQVVMDCSDPARLSEFWAAALGYVLQPPPEGYASWDELLTEMGVPDSERNSASAVVDPDGAGPRIYFQRVPEPKTAKNRVHLDLNVGGGGDTPEDEKRRRVDDRVRELVGAGAGIVRDAEERGERWVVMQDPEGNEFCVQ